MSTAISDRTYEALAELRTRLPLLREALVPGTPPRWSQRGLTPEAIERRAEAERRERDDRAWNIALGIKVIGSSPAPLRLEVLDTESVITEGVAVLEVTVCQWLDITPLTGAASAERITRLVGLLDRIAALEELAGYVLDEARRLNRRAAAALGDTEPVHRIDGRCPVCRAKSLRAFPEREVVACANSGCRCDDEACPCADGRRHVWTFDYWPALAELLAVA